jgi:predicted 2-oxoglutarate/Fe(II)-dependent dioxygenase YbiX
LTELLKIERFLDGATVDRMRRELRAAEGEPAMQLGSTPENRIVPTARRATRVAVSDSLRAAVMGRLVGLQPWIEVRFRRPLAGVEDPQFLRYVPGDYFVAHQDGNTPLVHDESRFRKVSVVIFLSAQSERPTPETFCGGSLVLHGPVGEPEPPLTMTPSPGTLVAFPSETTHEVLPITHGERLSIVSWYRSYEASSA